MESGLGFSNDMTAPINSKGVSKANQESPALAKLRCRNPQAGAVAELVAFIEYVEDVEAQLHRVSPESVGVEDMLVSDIHRGVFRFLLQVGKTCSKAGTVKRV